MIIQTQGMSDKAIAEVAKTKAEAWYICTPAKELLDYVTDHQIRDDTVGAFYKAVIDAKTAELIKLAKETGRM